MSNSIQKKIARKKKEAKLLMLILKEVRKIKERKHRKKEEKYLEGLDKQLILLCLNNS